MAVPSNSKSRNNGDSKIPNEISDRSQEPRFGFTGVGDSTVSSTSFFLQDDLAKVFRHAYNTAGILNFVRTLFVEELKNDYAKFAAFFGKH